MRNARHVPAIVLAAAAAAALAVPARAVSTVSLDFNGSGSTLAATGFDNVYNLDPTGFNVSGGKLTITTLPGDTFGQYGGPTDPGATDPDNVKNFFYSAIDPLQRTQVDAKVTMTGLNQNFHGGGIWMGTDTDHYIRLGVINNGGVVVEALRENQDLWSNNEQNGSPHGPGRDIVGTSTAALAASPQVGSLDVYLRLIRVGNIAGAFYSLDGVNYTQATSPTDDPAYPNFGAISIDGSNLGVPGAPNSSVENPQFKVGAYALGGGGSPATAAFDSFSAVSTPEPASATLAGAASAALLGRRRRR